ncbi:MAG: aminofutalosine synthase MqnE, partial [Nitrospirae bacterium]|nr:aminofutalosine synthase MqnE [Nitrospirota bacterium]
MIRNILDKAISGERLSKEDALELFNSDEIHSIGRVADLISKKYNSNRVYFVVNRHINPTNICVNRCRFCAFSRSKGDDGAFELTIDEIIERIQKAEGLKEVHIVGGLHPEWPFSYYLDMLRKIKERFPDLHIKAFTAVEIDYFARLSGLGLTETLQILKEHGLDAMPGGGAEIFNKPVRDRLCPEKISGERWLEIHRVAHELGIKTNATMLYGHIESYEDRVDHLLRLRELQDQTGGFQAFIPLSYHPENTDIGGRFPSGIDDLKTIAVSRLVLDNFQHIKAYWIMLGEKLSQIALLFGADDIDGTVIEEHITHAAGGKTASSMDKTEIIDIIKRAGKIPVERDALYNI